MFTVFLFSKYLGGIRGGGHSHLSEFEWNNWRLADMELDEYIVCRAEIQNLESGLNVDQLVCPLYTPLGV